MIKRLTATLFAVALVLSACSSVDAPKPHGPVPSARQLKIMEMEFYAFIHFSMNTFTDIEWGYGDKDPKLFNPTELDVRQWTKVIKEAGMKGVMITAKHHDGFCLWPSKYTEYSIKNSPFRDGKGDLLQELREACDEAGLKLGLYLSPWDRNHADYGKPEYVTYMRNQLKELMTNYGELFEVWFDGANGGSGYYGGANENRTIDRQSYYNWPVTRQIVRDLQPGANMFSDDGPDVRWIGNEHGIAGATNWATIDRSKAYPGFPGYKMLTSGVEGTPDWVFGECDVSIRPGWFYHKSEDHKVKTLDHLLDIYYKSVGRNATFLLNLPVDNRGLVHETDVKALKELRAALDADFKTNLAKGISITADQTRGNDSKFEAENMLDGDKETYWATDDAVKKASIVLDFGKPTSFNRFLAQEYVKLGQRVREFKLEIEKDGKWEEIAKQTTIGYKRILRFKTVTSQKLRFTILDSRACPTISNIEVYNAPQHLEAPVVIRNADDQVVISSHNEETDILYTTDGSNPTASSAKYTEPIPYTGNMTIKAVETDGKKISGVSSFVVDVPRKNWKALSLNDDNRAMFDGNQHSYAQSKDNVMELVIDMKKAQNIAGFRYTPDQSRWSDGIIFNYEFYVSNSKKSWGKPVSQGEFSNIQNNPIEQIKKFAAKKGRYVKLKALSTTNNSKRIRVAEFAAITQ